MPQQNTTTDTPKSSISKSPTSGVWSWLVKLVLWAVGLLAAGLACLLMVVAVAMVTAYPNLPDISDLADYKPKLPLRVFTADGQLMGEFGEERRNLTPIEEIPQIMKDAVLSIEDNRFYDHGGVDYLGILRAGIANIGRLKSQGASTITMQVARNVYLSSEKTYTRKIYEILLTYKLEHLLTKDQILEIYMNQIFLGNRAYGFASAAETYFDKPLKDITIAEAAMLAGLPKAPSAFNPIVNPKRARSRQLYIIERMEENGYITALQAAQAKAEPLALKTASNKKTLHAEFVAETVRQMVFNQYGQDTYTRGLNVYTTIQSQDQMAAYQALRQGLMDYERRQVYRGPEKFITLPNDPKLVEDLIDETLEDHPDNGDVMSAVVLEASSKKVVVVRQNSEQITITGKGLSPVQSGLSDKAPASKRIRKGAVVRITQLPKGQWELTQLPEVEGAFVALTPQTGAIRALVGGFDFAKNKFNHVTQAWRQPGSSFKPFIYSAALEKGISPATMVNDEPMFFDGGVTGGQPWEPKNYDGKFDGPMSLRTGLAKSKNMVSIRVLQSVGTRPAQEWVTRFGFDADKHPPYLTMALGAGSVTVMQMATGYSVFANGGYLVSPHLINRITDYKDRLLVDSPPPEINETSQRAIPQRNAFVMTSLMQEVTRSGTAARAQATLKRPDIYGKTGTTNDAMDAWFAGYHPQIAAVVWIGYDSPRKLGDRETGGGLSLPVWIRYMETALRNLPISEPTPAEGLMQLDGDWVYPEFSGSNGISSLGINQDASGQADAIPPEEERMRILDLFRN
ncbi:MAG: penicillin-binding protein 1A [Limnohabitans sp.]|jgi:penicillin-binding protein 1A|nr:penicillin-binding protein 1A [Limnohabitans sp.]MDP4734314.1 penicillin-binding protein 1A [Limnohabitans sp.]MDP4772984.1 penicillin-binding protein 1A [Limnohabitans sp.]